jgi:plastocyanin
MDLGRNAHPRRAVWAAMGLLAATAASAVPLEVRVEQVDGRPLGGAVVTLTAEAPQRAPAAAIDAVMDQVDRTFVPDVLVIPVGSRVTFPNSDSISHQVYSFSPVRKFQLPLYRGKPYPPVVFDQAGVATLGCNIHDEMRAYVVVTDGQYYGRSDARGGWRASDVAPGEYTLRVWHPRSREPNGISERRVRVAEAAPQPIVVRAASALRPAPRAPRPASWDAY